VARPRSLHATEARSADTSRAEVSARVETPAVESAKLEPLKTEARPDHPAKAEAAPELRSSTD